MKSKQKNMVVVVIVLVCVVVFLVYVMFASFALYFYSLFQKEATIVSLNSDLANKQQEINFLRKQVQDFKFVSTLINSTVLVDSKNLIVPAPVNGSISDPVLVWNSSVDYEGYIIVKVVSNFFSLDTPSASGTWILASKAPDMISGSIISAPFAYGNFWIEYDSNGYDYRNQEGLILPDLTALVHVLPSVVEIGVCSRENISLNCTITVTYYH